MVPRWDGCKRDRLTQQTRPPGGWFPHLAKEKGGGGGRRGEGERKKGRKEQTRKHGSNSKRGPAKDPEEHSTATQPLNERRKRDRAENRTDRTRTDRGTWHGWMDNMGTATGKYECITTTLAHPRTQKHTTMERQTLLFMAWHCLHRGAHGRVPEEESGSHHWRKARKRKEKKRKDRNVTRCNVHASWSPSFACPSFPPSFLSFPFLQYIRSPSFLHLPSFLPFLLLLLLSYLPHSL